MEFFCYINKCNCSIKHVVYFISGITFVVLKNVRYLSLYPHLILLVSFGPSDEVNCVEF